MIMKTTPPSIVMVRMGPVSVPVILPGLPVVAYPQQNYLSVPVSAAFGRETTPPPLLSREPESFNAVPVLTTSRDDQPQETVVASTSNSGLPQKEVTFEAAKQELLTMNEVQYRRFLQQYDADNEAVGQFKLIRKRDKNKHAARNCRSRKVELIKSMGDEIQADKTELGKLQAELAELTKQRDKFIAECNRYPEKAGPYTATD